MLKHNLHLLAHCVSDLGTRHRPAQIGRRLRCLGKDRRDGPVYGGRCRIQLGLLVAAGKVLQHHFGREDGRDRIGHSAAGDIGRVLKKWQDSPTNVRMIIELAEDGSVEGGWLFERDEVTMQGAQSFYDICMLNYPRYVDVFKPLRDRLMKPDFITYNTLWLDVDESNRRVGL